jgi:A/G-specific adenine glycosylase
MLLSHDPPLPTPRAVVAALLPWFAANARDLPWRHTVDPYAIWISEIMLQQTQVKTVIPYWERWLRDLPDAAALAAAPEARVLKLWEGLGYYSRARNLQQAARLVLEKFAGRFPTSAADLITLPGIGRYTAGAIASIAFNQPAPILDGNVIRVLTRLHSLPGDPKGKLLNAKLWQLAEELVGAAAQVPNSYPRIPESAGPCSALNQALMELGATLCTPRSPACLVCPLADQCRAHQAGQALAFPQSKARAVVTERRFVVAVLERAGKVLVRQRPSDVVNAGLWEFPNEELTAPPLDPLAAAVRWLNLPASGFMGLKSVKHSITRYRITLDVFRAAAGSHRLAVETGAVWLALAELEALAFTSAHRRIARQLDGPVSVLLSRRKSNARPSRERVG